MASIDGKRRCKVCGVRKYPDEFDRVGTQGRSNPRCRECLLTERRGNEPYTPEDVSPPNLSGQCFCGCGEITPISDRSKVSTGILKGHHVRYVKGHSQRAVVGSKWDPDEAGCLIWNGRLDKAGYGLVEGARGPDRRAHQQAWIRKHGPIPDGHGLHHRCLNRACVNPDHLVPLTQSDHMRVHTQLRGIAMALASDDD